MSATVIELDQEGSASILRIEGDITSASEPDLMAAYGLAVANGATAVILDFTKLTLIGAGTFTRICRQAKPEHRAEDCHPQHIAGVRWCSRSEY